MNKYSVKLYYKDENEQLHYISDFPCEAENKKKAYEMAIDNLWDERLTAASCSPYIEIKRIK